MKNLVKNVIAWCKNNPAIVLLLGKLLQEFLKSLEAKPIENTSSIAEEIKEE